MKNIVVLLLLAAFAFPCFAEDQDVRASLKEAIEARYRSTVIGASFMGIKGGTDSIRKLGGTLLVMKKGLFATLDRVDVASNYIRDGKSSLLTGKGQVELQPGDRVYANGIVVGTDSVSLGVLSVNPRLFQQRNARVWASLSFYFPPEVIKTGDIKKINAVMDEWILPADAVSNVQAPTAVKAAPVAPVVELPATVSLETGMSKDAIVTGLGKPMQTINFGNKSWMTYPALTVVLEDDKLLSVDRAEDSAGTLNLTSAPPNADIYVDGEMSGTTPMSLRVPVGPHAVELKKDGRSVWQQNVRVFAGADVKLNPKVATDGK